MRLMIGALFLVAMSGAAHAEEGGTGLPWGEALSEGELSATSGLGLVVEGDENIVANAESSGTISNVQVGDVERIGDVSNNQITNASGVTTVMMNTAPNVNQINSTSISIHMQGVDAGVTP